MSFAGLWLQLRALRSAIKELCDAVQEHSKTIHAAQEAQQEAGETRKPMPVIIAYDDQTIRDTKDENNRQHGTQNSIKNWTKVAVIAASIYAAIAALQWNEMRKATVAATSSATTASDAMHRGQRAYLVFHHATLVKPPKVKEELHATVDLENSGETPAVEASYYFAVQILPGDPQTITYGTLRPLAPIGAGQKLVLDGERLNSLTPEEMGEIMTSPFSVNGNALVLSNQPQLYLYGIVRYRDVFGGQGQTEFCSVYNGGQKVFMGCPTHTELK
jgi:hypothetical protein